ncbi:hypothetical protein B0H13DRAFT_1911037 [Mycena leptocephala]|nr:hypothetical protein B0H13DRAFT_1911037 [Mycena leptocephala]
MADSRADAVIAEEGGEWEQDKRNAGSQCITRIGAGGSAGASCGLGRSAFQIELSTSKYYRERASQKLRDRRQTGQLRVQQSTTSNLNVVPQMASATTMPYQAAAAVHFPSSRHPTNRSTTDAPITYQTLELLLADLNVLLYTPHAGRPFNFLGRRAFLAREDKGGGMGVIHGSGNAAVAKTQSAALWMGDEQARYGGKARSCPCERCEHLLTISVWQEDRAHVDRQEISVGLSHFATVKDSFTQQNAGRKKNYYTLRSETTPRRRRISSGPKIHVRESRQESLPGSGWMQTWNKNGESDDCASLDVAKSTMRPVRLAKIWFNTEDRWCGWNSKAALHARVEMGAGDRRKAQRHGPMWLKNSTVEGGYEVEGSCNSSHKTYLLNLKLMDLGYPQPKRW